MLDDLVVMFTKDDLKPLDVKAHVLRAQHLYFDESGATANKICIGIAEGAKILGSTDVAIFTKNGWSVVASNHDWLNQSNLSNANQTNLFKGIHGFPEAGINSVRSEYFSYVFSSALCLWSSGEVETIKGDCESLRELSDELHSFKKALGFKFEKVI
jgi:hypothetical protein